MKHAAALLLAATIAGSPLTTLVCVGWCFPETVPASSVCHHEMQPSAAAGVRATDGNCARVLAVAPFIREDIQVSARAGISASLPQATFAGAPGEAQLVHVRHVAEAAPHRSISALVLRL